MRPDTRKKQSAFLAAYQVSGLLVKSCQVAGIDPKRHYEWLDNDPSYLERFTTAHEIAVETIEEEAYRRAVTGIERQVGWYKGQPGGVELQYSDFLMGMLLKAAKPAKYRERYDITGADGGPIQVDQRMLDFSTLSLEEKRQMLMLWEKAGAVIEPQYKMLNVENEEVRDVENAVSGIRLCKIQSEYDGDEISECGECGECEGADDLEPMYFDPID